MATNPITRHFNKTATTERLQTVSGNKQAFAEYLTDLAVAIQPLDPDINQDMEGSFGKNFLMFSKDVDITEGDRVIIDSKKYRVMGTESLTFNNKSHKETILKKWN